MRSPKLTVKLDGLWTVQPLINAKFVQSTCIYPDSNLEYFTNNDLNFHAASDPSSMFPDVYPFFEEVGVFESPPPRYHFNSKPEQHFGLHLVLLPSFLCYLHSLPFFYFVE